MEEWTTALENGGQINTIYTDFEKAFNKVPHYLLLKKLQSYNLNVNIQWIRLIGLGHSCVIENKESK